MPSNDQEKEVTESTTGDETPPVTFESAIGYLKSGGGYDLTAAAMFLTHGVLVPPSIIKRFRIGVGRLIDGGFDAVHGYMTRAKSRSDFETKIQQELVKKMTQSGGKNLIDQSPEIPTAIALSMLNEYGLKLDNKAAVSREAFIALAQDPPLQDSSPESTISSDWLNYFSDIAAQKSDPEMQRLMGQILAGEIRKPGSFSPLSVHALATLTPTIARKFEQLCSASFEMNNSFSFILTSMFPEFHQKGIPDLGLQYVDILALRSHQLLATETGSNFQLVPGNTITLSNCGKQYLLMSGSDIKNDQQIPVALFSQVGSELRRLVSPSPAPGIHEKMLSSFSGENWRLSTLPS